MEARLALDPVPASAARARGFVGDLLARWSCDELVDAGRLLASELVTNAVLHARTGMTLVVRRMRNGVRIEVHDGSPLAPVVRNYEDGAMTGRGLSLVQELATRWGVDREATGKTVWFELRE